MNKKNDISEMLDLEQLKRRIIQNKINKGFNTTDLRREFCYAFSEMGEAYTAYEKKLPDLGEELADVMIFILGISELLDIDIEKELLSKIEKNENRVYKVEDGVNVRISE